jgi:molybdopterin biosynthesis enzyme MoaB
MLTPAKHKKGAKKQYKCAIITISTSKYWKNEEGEDVIADLSGEIAKELVTRNGHEVVYYTYSLLRLTKHTTATTPIIANKVSSRV